MSIKGLFTKSVNVPVLGSFNLKDVTRWGATALILGVVLFAVSKIPYVGPAVGTGLGKVRGWFAWNQA